MSNFLNNTTDLEKIYNEVDGIDDLMIEQDNLITQIATALEGKTETSDSKKIETCNMYINNMSGEIYYTDENQALICNRGTPEGGEYINMIKSSIIYMYGGTRTYTGITEIDTIYDFEGDGFFVGYVVEDGTITIV